MVKKPISWTRITGAKRVRVVSLIFFLFLVEMSVVRLVTNLKRSYIRVCQELVVHVARLKDVKLRLL